MGDKVIFKDYWKEWNKNLTVVKSQQNFIILVDYDRNAATAFRLTPEKAREMAETILMELGTVNEELEGFVREQLELHKKIMDLVKPYVEKLFREYGININSNETRNTFLAMVLELTRSIFINYSYYTREKRLKEAKQPKAQ